MDDTFWGLYVQGAEVPIFIGLFMLFVALPLGLWQAKKRQNSLLATLRRLASDFNGEFIYKPFDSGSFVGAFKDPDCSEYEIKFDFNGRECNIFPYAYPSHASGRSQLTPFAAWATVFRMKMKQPSSVDFSLRYETKKRIFVFPFQRDSRFKESNVSVKNREYFDKVANYENLIDFIKNIQFIEMPFFEIRSDADMIYVKVDKVENKIEDIKKYLNLMEEIVKNIESGIK